MSVNNANAALLSYNQTITSLLNTVTDLNTRLTAMEDNVRHMHTLSYSFVVVADLLWLT